MTYPKPVRAPLRDGDTSWAWDVAVARWGNMRDRGVPAYQGQSRRRHALLSDLMGALGELAVCRIIRVPWDATVDTFHRRPDIAPDIEVRYSTTGHKLIVRDKDPSRSRVVLVTGRPPNMRALGWAFAGEVREQGTQTFDGKRPTWSLPTARLRDMQTLEIRR